MNSLSRNFRCSLMVLSASLLVVLVWSEAGRDGAPEAPRKSADLHDGFSDEARDSIENATAASPATAASSSADCGAEGEALPYRAGPETGGVEEPSAASAMAIPPPPAEYRGTPLEWRLKFPMAATERLDLVRRLPSLGPRDRLALLRSIPAPSDSEVSRSLLSVKDRMPDDPQTQATYIRALIAAAHAEEPRTNSLGSMDRELIGEAMGVLTTLVTSWNGVFDEQAWSGIQRRLGEIRAAAPDLLEGPEGAPDLDQIRSVVEANVTQAISERPGYRGGVGLLCLAAEIADEGTRGLFLRLLESWAVVRTRFWITSQRADLRAHYVVASCLLDGGTPNQRFQLAHHLVEAKRAYAEDTCWQKHLANLARRLANHPDTEAGTRDIIISAYGNLEPFSRRR